MCGIVGVLQQQQPESQSAFINWALEAMHHRGPDSNGNWHDAVFHTGFVRLSIRDLSHHGNQPMHSQCGRYVIVFNGEIYNSDNFKAAIIKDGIQFKSTSDTEVLLNALIKWPPQEILPKLNGMFAFAFYDKQEQKLLLARDRLGIKPLYLGWSRDGIVFSSQYDHIINHPYCKSNSINADAFSQYISLGYIPDKAGIIQNTMLFPHGYYATVSLNASISFHEYYAYPVAANKHNSNNLSEVLQQSVEQQLVSDVPLGTFMSGGIDSTLVTSYAVNKVNNIQSFTIGVENSEMDESEAAQGFANIFKTNHHCTFIKNSDVLNMIEENFKAYSEPFADYSSLPTLLLSKIAKEKVTVVLSGDGGDELFWGYPRNQKIIQHAQAFKESIAIRNVQFLKEKLLQPSERHYFKRHLFTDDYIHYYYKSIFINGAEFWMNRLIKETKKDPYFLNKIIPERNDLNNVSMLMNKIRKVEVDLHLQRILLKVDRASMMHSLEVRVPLLDNEVIDYSTLVNYKDCIVNAHGKYNLKKILAAITNDSLVYQPKKGFTVPLALWMRHELYNEISNTILTMPLHWQLFFNKKTLQQMLINHQSGKQDNSWILWAIYSLIKWDNIHRNKFKN